MTNIKERQARHVTILDIHGKLKNSKALQDITYRLVKEGKNQILLNLAKASYIDSSGLGKLVASHDTLKKTGGQIKLLHLTQSLRDLMTITKLLTIFDVYEDESEALNSFKNHTTKLEENPQTLLTEPYYRKHPQEWGEFGMSVTFRAELMLSRSHLERTFSVKKLLPSGRVTLNGIQGQYVEGTFERVQYAEG